MRRARPFTVLNRIPHLSAVAAALLALPAAAQNQLWLAQDGSFSLDQAFASAPDGAGGAYVVGYTMGSFGGPSFGSADAWIARYASGGGNPAWVRQIGTAGVDYGFAAAPDPTGGVYASGWTTGSLGGPNAGSFDVWIARYDAAGGIVWTRQLGSIQEDRVYASAPDETGGVFVAGLTYGDLGAPNAGMEDAWLALYDSAGNQLWIRQLGTSDRDFAFAAASDGSDGVYVCGVTYGDLGAPNAGFNDAWLARYDGSGNQLWIRQQGTPSYDYLFAAAPDAGGGLFVSGYTYGSFVGPSAGSADAWLARYTAGGSLLWTRELGTSAADGVNAAAPDASGGVYVSGFTTGSLAGDSAGAYDAWLARFDAAGVFLWSQQVGTSTDEWVNAAAPDGTGGVYVSGFTEGALVPPLLGVNDAFVARYAGECNPGATYCNASGSSIPGCQATIAGTGSPSLTNPGAYAITSGNVPGGAVGLCFFGNGGAASTPIGSLGGLICVEPPHFRTSIAPSGGTAGACDGSYTFTLQDLANASRVVASGAVIHAQIWSRDLANPDGFVLSDGLRFVVCP